MMDWQKEQLKVATGVTDGSVRPMHPELKKMWEDYFDKCFAAFAKDRESSAVQEPVAWRDLTNDEMFALCRDIQSGKHSAYDILWEVSTRLKARNHPQPKAEQCLHRLVDVTNPLVKSGYMCIDCGAVFRAAFESEPKAEQESKREPLTDAQLKLHYQNQEWLDGVRFAEAAHGIKGEA